MATQRPRPRARRRDSDTVLRASVLDAAIELGIGNKTVAKWMFSPVEEGEEEDELGQEHTIQELSYPTTTTSDEHSQNDSHPIDQGPAHAVHFSTSSTSTHSNYLPPSASLRKASHNKLRKAKRDGYDTDGGYASDATRKKYTKKSKKKDKDGAVTNDEESDGGYLSEASAKRKVSFFGRKKTKKSKDEEKFPVPPVPYLGPQFPDRFGVRSTTPSTFVSSNRSSWTDVSSSQTVTPISTPALPPSRPQEDHIQALTHAFRGEDAQSITGSIDWSNTYSHFPRVVRSPHPPLPSTTQERSHSNPKPSLPPTLTAPHIRPVKARPSPLSLSPLSSDYRHASEHSPVPSESVMISPDPTPPPSTSTLRNKLLIAANTTPGALLPTHCSPGPSPIEPTPSFDFVVPIPSPGGSIRSRQFELPPPSPAPRGPLPKVPPISPPNDHPHHPPLLKTPSALLQSRLTTGGLSPRPSPARTPSPGIRGREQPFPVNPVITVQEAVDASDGKPYYPQKLNNPSWTIPRQPPPLPPSPAPAVEPSRKSIGASSYTSSNMDSEIEAIEALYRDTDGSDRADEALNHADVDSVISMFGGHPSTRESGSYEPEPRRRSNDGEFGNSRLSKPIRIQLDEDDYVSPTGGYLDMDSDLEDDYTNPKEDGRYTVWDRQSFVDETRSGETRSRFVRGVESLYRKDGGPPPVSALSSRKPAAYI